MSIFIWGKDFFSTMSRSGSINKTQQYNNLKMSSENAVQANIKQKGERAYYYAHSREWDCEDATVTEGEGIITGGPPVLLVREESKTEP